MSHRENATTEPGNSPSAASPFTILDGCKPAPDGPPATESKLQVVFDGVETGIFLIDPETHQIIDANPLALKLVGARRELVLGATCHKFICPADQGRCPVTDLGQKVDNSDRVLLTVTGERLAILKTVRSTLMAGRPVLVESFVDISAHKRAEDALRESEDRYRDLVENSFFLIGTHDAKGRVLGLNRAAAVLMEATNAAEMVGRPLTDYVPPELQPQFAEYLRTVLREGHAEGLMVIATPSGKVKLVEYRNTLRRQDAEEPIIRMVGHDVTERIQAEKAQAFLASLVESSQDAIIGETLEGTILSWNRGAEELYGYSAAEMTGKSAAVLFPPEIPGELPQHLEKIRHGERISGYESVRVRKDGSRVDVALTISPVFDTTGNITCAVSIGHNITERKQAEEMRKAKEEAETASRVKSQFLASMSHEIRTPINGVIGMTSLLLDTELSPEQRRYAQVASTCGETLLNLINNILDLSKIEARKLSLEVIDFNLRAMLEHTVEMLAMPASEKGLELTCLVAPETPSWVRGDPARLRQILLNLAVNAVKFTQQGEVGIRVRLDDENEDTVTLRFAVEDTGIGIPKDRIDAIFSPFVQADDSTTRKYGGTGLGLTISKQLVEIMGGQISLESEEGKGSTFWFTVVQQKVKAQDTPESETSSEFEGVKVLVVDDNATSRMVVGSMLKSWGCRLGLAASGDAALAALRKAARLADPFDVALVDVEMPGMDGKEMGRQTAADSHLAHTVLLMMANPSRGNRQGDSWGQEGTSCITKPVMESRLSEALNGALGRKIAPIEPGGANAWKQLALKPAHAGARILVAEDISSNREVALGFLTKLGYCPDLVANGAEALAAVESAAYDLVLMDCEMPEMDGYEATRRIRAQEALAGKERTPIVALTAHAISGDKDKCLEAGMDDYLSKPIELQALANALARLLAASPVPEEREVKGNPSREPVYEIFDEAGLLRRMIEDRTLAGKVVTKFLQDAPALLSQLQERLEAGDVAETKRRAHGLKGAASTAAAESLRDLALKIEDAAIKGDLMGAAEFLPGLHERFDQLRTYLHVAGWD